MFISLSAISHPLRIISLVPSITELLFELGLAEQTVGITKFCVKPSALVKSVEKIGGTKNLNLKKIKSLHPNLIIANKEENNKEQVEILATLFPVFLTDVNNYNDALKMISAVGNITSKSKEAVKLIEIIEAGFKLINNILRPLKTVYLIWKDPYMTIGGDNFINDMLHKIGLENIFNYSTRYPQVTLQQINDHAPDLILLSSEPYPFKQKHIEAIQLYLPNTKILLVDGEMFSWYGSRMKYMPTYFKNLLLKIEETVT